MNYLEEISYTQASCEKVWKAWAKANPWNNWEDNKTSFEVGQKGRIASNKGKGVPYQILDIQEGKSFTILWKALFVKVFFEYLVEPEGAGSKIVYRVKVKGFFALPIRGLLYSKIQKSLTIALKDFVRQLNH